MDYPVVRETDFSDLNLKAKGKVRDIYDLDDKLLLVATDRLSAFDVVFPDPIPGKGIVLNKLSKHWFKTTRDIIPNHYITDDVSQYPEKSGKYAGQLAGRSMLVKKTEPLKIECVARGYVVGSGWKDYQKTGGICGIPLPEGLQLADRLPQPIFTPSTKADEGHDMNISFEKACEIVGEETAQLAKKKTLELYSNAAEKLLEKGIILADTKFEFGILDGEMILIDEALTPDSSRFWPKDGYQPGRNQPSYDKQYVRDFLEETSWDKSPPAPSLPEDVIMNTSRKYREIHSIITGEDI